MSSSTAPAAVWSCFLYRLCQLPPHVGFSGYRSKNEWLNLPSKTWNRLQLLLGSGSRSGSHLSFSSCWWITCVFVNIYRKLRHKPTQHNFTLMLHVCVYIMWTEPGLLIQHWAAELYWLIYSQLLPVSHYTNTVHYSVYSNTTANAAYTGILHFLHLMLQ